MNYWHINSSLLLQNYELSHGNKAINTHQNSMIMEMYELIERLRGTLKYFV